MPSKPFSLLAPFLALGLGSFLLLSGTEYLLLGFIGVKDTAIVTHASEHFHTRGGKSYTATYAFTTSDGAQYGGVQSGFQRKPGSLRIRYLNGYPSIHRVEATPAATLFMTTIFLLPGFLGMGFGFWRFGRRILLQKPGDPSPIHMNEPGVSSPGRLSALIGLGFALAVGFLAFAVDRRAFFVKAPLPGLPEGLAGPPGNSAGNLNQGGHGVFDGTTVFFSGFGYRPIFRASVDGSAASLFHGGSAQNLNLSGDFLYFLQFDPSEGVRPYRMPKQGGKAKRLMKESVSGLWVLGEWLYFTPEHGDHKLHRARLDGSGVQKLHEDVARNVVFTPEWVFYSNEAYGQRIFRMRHHGAKRECLSQSGAEEILPIGDRLYYRTTRGQIHSMKQNGADDRRFLNTEARGLNSDGRWLYYCDFRDDACLYRLSLEGGTPEKLTDNGVLFPHILGDWIYVGVGDLANGLVPHRLRRDVGNGKPGPLHRWP